MLPSFVATALSSTVYTATGLGSAYIASKIFLSDAEKLYTKHFPNEAKLLSIKKNDAQNLPESIQTERRKAINEWNAFAHAYISARFVETFEGFGISRTNALELTKTLGTGREDGTEIWYKLISEWGIEKQQDRNRDEWNNRAGAHLGTQGLTDEQKGAYLKKQILTHRKNPNSSDLIIDFKNDTRRYTGTKSQVAVESLTEEEISLLMRTKEYRNSSYPGHKEIHETVRQWHIKTYGAQTPATDATGRIIPSPPRPLRKPARKTDSVRVRAHTRESGKEHVKAHERTRPGGP